MISGTSASSLIPKGLMSSRLSARSFLYNTFIDIAVSKQKKISSQHLYVNSILGKISTVNLFKHVNILVIFRTFYSEDKGQSCYELKHFKPLVHFSLKFVHFFK